MTITPSANQHGVVNLTLTIGDGSLDADNNFSLTVNSVNDEPAGANATVATDEDIAYTFTA